MDAELTGIVAAVLPEYGVTPLADRVARLAEYLEYLIRWNRRIRLVGSAEPATLARRHLGESLYLSAVLPLGRETLIDVGSGGGFPGLALQIAFPSLISTLVESNARKAAFLQEMTRHLGCGRVIVARAEAVRQQAEIVTLRAIEHMEIGPERFAHLLIPGGKLAAWVGLDLAADWRRRFTRWHWSEPVLLPQSRERAILIGQRA